MENTLAVIRPSVSLTLSTALDGLAGQFERAARENVTALDMQFTRAETEAMVVIEQLKLINGLDLAAILIRGRLLKDIEDRALYSVHPSGYQTLEEMARDQGISVSQLSNIRDMCSIIFPYVENELGVSIAEIWEEIGVSNFRELIPVLKSIITGENSNRAAIRSAVERILEEVRELGEVDGRTMEEAEVRRQAIDNLLQQGQVMTNRELRTTIRPERTPPTQAIFFWRGERCFMVSEMDRDQHTNLLRRAGSIIESQEVPLTERVNPESNWTFNWFRNFLEGTNG